MDAGFVIYLIVVIGALVGFIVWSWHRLDEEDRRNGGNDNNDDQWQ